MQVATILFIALAAISWGLVFVQPTLPLKILYVGIGLANSSLAWMGYNSLS